MNEKSFSVESGGVLRDVKEIDDGWELHIEPHENDVVIRVRAKNGSNAIHKSEAVWAYKRQTGKLPGYTQIMDINAEGIEDVARWEKVVHDYCSAGGWQGKVNNMLSIYRGEKPPLGTPKAKEPEKVVDPLSSLYR